MNVDIDAALKASGKVHKLATAGPTWRDMVDTFGSDSLWVELADGTEVAGTVNEDGTVSPSGSVRVAVCRPDFTPERNAMRLEIFDEMMNPKRRLQIEHSEEVHATTDHVLWTDRDGEKRAAPAESADHAIRKTGVAPMTHPKVWRPHG